MYYYNYVIIYVFAFWKKLYIPVSRIMVRIPLVLKLAFIKKWLKIWLDITHGFRKDNRSPFVSNFLFCALNSYANSIYIEILWSAAYS